ncbi:unnamed protein product [marine sediment metagenome]|uniref:Uncharacterized protein n=1 Tax=marine sediment metagenome TaxID=412755 RepID=X1SAW9_9ZZZZ
MDFKQKEECRQGFEHADDTRVMAASINECRLCESTSCPARLVIRYIKDAD